jgi:hypothetical protein
VLAIAQALAFAAHAAAASMPKARDGSAAPSAGMAAPLQSMQGAPTATSPPNATVLLSNERTLTTWANPVGKVPIRANPDRSSRTVARTRLETEDGFPEVYVLLALTTDARGRVWVRMRIPGRPNGRVGWVPQSALGEFHVTYWLIEIRLGARRLTAYYDGRLRFSAPVGVGKPSTPTPTGHFWIRERMKMSSPGNVYWPYALGTSAYSSLTEWPGGGRGGHPRRPRRAAADTGRSLAWLRADARRRHRLAGAAGSARHTGAHHPLSPLSTPPKRSQRAGHDAHIPIRDQKHRQGDPQSGDPR